MLGTTNTNSQPGGSIFIFNVWLALSILGLIMVTSVSADFSLSSTQSMWYFSMRHSIDLGIAFAFLIAAWLTPLSFWQRYHKPLFVIGLAMLVALLIPQISFSDDLNRRWIGNERMAWQPTELFKFLFVIYVAALLMRKGELLATSNLHLFHVCMIALVPILLLLMQFDYGTALIISITFALLLFVTGLPLLKWCGVVAVWALIVFGVLLVGTDLGKELIPGFGDATEELVLMPTQPAEELVPFGPGDLWGLGLGHSTQKLAYLSEAHTSYIFAVLSEELGFISATIVVVMFLLLMLRGTLLGWYHLRAKEVFTGLLLTGVTLLLVLPALLNIAINLGLLPPFNSSLPFISYGANNLIVSSVLIGVLLSGESEYSSGSTKHAG